MLEGALCEWCADSGISVPESRDLRASMNQAGYTLPQLWAPPVGADMSEVEETRWLNVLIRQAYNLGGDDTRFRQAMIGSNDPATAFRQLRKTYPVRRAWSELSVSANVPDAIGVAIEKGLRMKLQVSG